MRTVGVIMFLLAGSAVADPMPRVIESLPVQPPAAVQLEWNNNRPEQREALDHFYRSIQAQQQQDLMLQRLQRQQHVDQMRGMSPEQRQQQFLNFIQQQQHAATLAPR